MVLCTQQYKSAFMAFIQTSSFKLAANVSLSETKKKKKRHVYIKMNKEADNTMVISFFQNSILDFTHLKKQTIFTPNFVPLIFIQFHLHLNHCSRWEFSNLNSQTPYCVSLSAWLCVTYTLVPIAGMKQHSCHD